MDRLDSKVDLFQSLKDEESNEHDEAPHKSISDSDDMKYETRSDDDNNMEENVNTDDMGEAGTSSCDKGMKKKLDKQNRKEIEEEEREKML